MTDLTSKQADMITAITDAVLLLLNADAAATLVATEWSAMAYATGASPSGNNITDSVAEAARPSLNALILNQSMGALASVQATIAANRGYLEAIRP